jgi:hypothetical protein
MKQTGKVRLELKMRKPGTWMRWPDEKILENLSEEGKLTAWMIAHNLNTNDLYVGHRLDVLSNADFVDRISRDEKKDIFEITTWGEQYLTGEIDAQLRQPEPSPRPPDKVRPGWYAGFG